MEKKEFDGERRKITRKPKKQKYPKLVKNYIFFKKIKKNYVQMHDEKPNSTFFL